VSDLDPIISTAKAATKSIKSAIESGREISSAVESIQNFGMAEVKARHAFKTVRSKQEGEITIMTAMSEWRRLDQIRRMELEVRDFLVQQFGEFKGLEEFEKVKKIKEDMMTRHSKTKDALGRDVKKLRELQIICVMMAFMVVTIYYIAKGHL
jgi:nitrogenase molybdenum-iron protein alpha/beta subunit